MSVAAKFRPAVRRVLGTGMQKIRPQRRVTVDCVSNLSSASHLQQDQVTVFLFSWPENGTDPIIDMGIDYAGHQEPIDMSQSFYMLDGNGMKACAFGVVRPSDAELENEFRNNGVSWSALDQTRSVHDQQPANAQVISL